MPPSEQPRTETPPSGGPDSITMFTYQAAPARVLFGWGTLESLPEEVEALGLRRALVLATPPQRASAEQVAALLGEAAVGIFAEAAMHTPVAITERAVAAATELGADCLVAVGGGSTTGLGKAIALRTDLAQIVIPTTYAGSEMTPILGQTEGGRKTTLRSPKVLPEVVIYDVALTLGLPQALSATSGVNAIAHAVEALYAKDRNPVISLMAEEGIRALASGLPRIIAAATDHVGRGEALYGAFLCGTCLGAVGMALHHKLCHVVAGSFNLPHAETHTIILPHAMAYNAAAAPDAAARIARALGAADAARGLYDLVGRLGAPRGLREIGMPESGIEQAVREASENPYWNPSPIEPERIRALLRRAWEGGIPRG